MRASRLKERLVFSAPTMQADAYGQEIETFTTLATVWGQVVEPQASEQQIRDGTSHQQRIQIIVRKLATITSRARVQYKGELYNIVGVSKASKSHYMSIIAERAV